MRDAAARAIKHAALRDRVLERLVMIAGEAPYKVDDNARRELPNVSWRSWEAAGLGKDLA